ncbi:hypothetical protein [Streptomyces sp. WZ-12]|uniref:hypothetical protein n=1 Tax=Streptomyces sp. WZ-12 TaxID=3030210 RepID=UPI0023817EF4|nr:hypothetical protein [Streptomyces sp. WZ-12]
MGGICGYELHGEDLCGAQVKGRPYPVSLNGENYEVWLCGQHVAPTERFLKKLIKGNQAAPDGAKKVWRDDTGFLATSDDIKSWLKRAWESNPKLFLDDAEKEAVQALVEMMTSDRPQHRQGRMPDKCIAAWRRLRSTVDDADGSWEQHTGDLEDMAEIRGVLRYELQRNPGQFSEKEAALVGRLPKGANLPPEALVLYGKVMAMHEAAQAKTG